MKVLVVQSVFVAASVEKSGGRVVIVDARTGTPDDDVWVAVWIG